MKHLNFFGLENAEGKVFKKFVQVEFENLVLFLCKIKNKNATLVFNELFKKQDYSYVVMFLAYKGYAKDLGDLLFSYGVEDIHLIDGIDFIDVLPEESLCEGFLNLDPLLTEKHNRKGKIFEKSMQMIA